MSDFDVTLGRIVRDRRKALGLDQTALARRFSVVPRYQSIVAKIETGVRPVKAEEIPDLAAALHLAPWDLLGGGSEESDYANGYEAGRASAFARMRALIGEAASS